MSVVWRRFNISDRMIQKIIGEEATETVIAAKNNKKKRIIEETADLFFHLLVLLSQFDIKPDEMEMELQKRKK